MNHVLLKFTSTIFFTSLAFIVIPFIAQAQGWIQSAPSFSIEIVLVLALLTLVLFFNLQNIQKANPQKFIQSYILSITLKMAVGCALILAIIFINQESSMSNALLFLSTYFIFTGIEIFFLWKGRTAP
jgi:hypothetical protein